MEREKKEREKEIEKENGERERERERCSYQGIRGHNSELQSESLSYNKQCPTVIFSNQMDFVKFRHWIIQDCKSY